MNTDKKLNCGKTPEEIFLLSQNHPKEFKKWEREQINTLISRLANTAERKSYYLQFQWKIDMTVRKHKNLLGAAIALNEMLLKSRLDLLEKLVQFSSCYSDEESEIQIKNPPILRLVK